MAKRKVELQQENELEKRYLSQLNRKRKIRTRRRLLRFVGLLIVALLVFAYFSSDISKVKTLTVENNMLYSDDQILEKAGLDYQSSYILNPGFLIKMRLKEDPLIKDVSVTKTWGGGIMVSVEESLVIGYLKNAPQTLLVQGIGKFNAKDLSQLNAVMIPRIGGFTDEQLTMLDEAFEKVDKEVMPLISELEPYVTSYDENMVQFVMIDGNRVTTSMKGIEMLNSYRSVLKELEGTHVCLYMDDISGNIFKEVDDCSVGLKDREPKPSENENEGNAEGETPTEEPEGEPQEWLPEEEIPSENE